MPPHEGTMPPAGYIVRVTRLQSILRGGRRGEHRLAVEAGSWLQRTANHLAVALLTAMGLLCRLPALYSRIAHAQPVAMLTTMRTLYASILPHKRNARQRGEERQIAMGLPAIAQLCTFRVPIGTSTIVSTNAEIVGHAWPFAFLSLSKQRAKPSSLPALYQSSHPALVLYSTTTPHQLCSLT